MVWYVEQVSRRVHEKDLFDRISIVYTYLILVSMGIVRTEMSGIRDL